MKKSEYIMQQENIRRIIHETSVEKLGMIMIMKAQY